MKRFVIVLMALALGLSVSAQRGRYNKVRKPVRTTHRAAPRPVTTIKTCPDDNHPHAIDLGLPSGTKWACCNVGASKPTAYGNYYAWGETSPKANYDEDTHKWYKSKWNSEWGRYDRFFTKYCTNSEEGYNGFTDNKTTLDLGDDAAHANWGGEWRMPDCEDCAELIEHTTNKWVKNFNGTGKKGYLFTGKNGKRIFLPAAGSRYGTWLYDAGSHGDYWSSSLTGFAYGPVVGAYDLDFCSGDVDGYDDGRGRCSGLTVRPVRPSQREAPNISTCPDDNHPHAIDLGLPSGTKWACCNVGASKPTAYGNYYAWGETSPKANYDEDTYKWYKSKWNSVWEKYDYFCTKYCTDSEEGYNGFTDNKTSLDLGDDAAHANWGGVWRMPLKEDFEELIEHTSKRWVKNFNGTGVKGRLFTGKNGKCIFLPAAGDRYGASLNDAGSHGSYWSSSLLADDPGGAYSRDFDSGGVDVYDYGHSRYYGHTVRPVRP